MTLAHGPLGSATARGALAGVISFRRSARGTVITRSPKPRDPATPAQLGRRALMRLLQTTWTAIGQDFWDLWKPTPETTNHTAYLLYLKTNLLEFPNFLAPKCQPDRLPGILTWPTASQSITPKIHALYLVHTKTSFAPPGSYLIYRRLGGIPDESIHELVGGTYSQDAANLAYTDVVPTLDPYGYRVTRWEESGMRSVAKTFAATAPLDA